MEPITFIKHPFRFIKKDVTAVDMHCHTQYSYDGITNITDAIKKAKKQNIGFAVTDHNTIKGALKLKSEKNALIIPGIEITSYEGVHIVLYFYGFREMESFYNKNIKPNLANPFVTSIKAKELFDKTKGYNCVICTPHPFAPLTTSIKNIYLDNKMLKSIDLVEVLNGINTRKRNLKAVEWCTALGKGITGGSDSHTIKGLGSVLTFSYNNSLESFLNSLLKRDSWVIGSEDGRLRKVMNVVFKERCILRKNIKDKNEIKRIKYLIRVSARYAFSWRTKNRRTI